MNKVKLGVIGAGSMGREHLKHIAKNDKFILAGVCDANTDNARKTAHEYASAFFGTLEDMIKAGNIDALLIATPHFSHTQIGVAALEAGLHVLVEKPISVHKADCEKLIAAHKNRDQIFAAMFNQRTDPKYRRLKNLIDRGELGEIQRVNWIITNWFRTETYYRSGSWRATWQGEGGGVLLNQCPHQLDLLQWLCGMPTKVRAFCHLGKYHNIEVEDEVTAYLEYANGASGVFISSTGEAPGTNRLEITADRGKVVIENDKVSFSRTEVSVKEFRKNSTDMWGKPDIWQAEIPTEGNGGQHAEILDNFADAILKGKPLIAPAAEGLNSVELANAMLYSSLTDKTVELPLDGKAYENKLHKLISAGKRK